MSPVFYILLLCSAYVLLRRIYLSFFYIIPTFSSLFQLFCTNTCLFFPIHGTICINIQHQSGGNIMAKEMIAMLLAGGQGSRLYALTQKLAKPAVPFGG